MSTVTDPPAAAPAAPAFTPSPLPPQHLLDVSGLPDAVVADLRRLVETLRHTLTLLPKGPPPGPPHKPLKGMFAHLGITFTEEEIKQARRDLWGVRPAGDPVDGPS